MSKCVNFFFPPETTTTRRDENSYANAACNGERVFVNTMAVRVDRYGRKITESRRLHKVIETARARRDCFRNAMKKNSMERFTRAIPRRISFAMNERHVICKSSGLYVGPDIKKKKRRTQRKYYSEMNSANIARRSCGEIQRIVRWLNYMRQLFLARNFFSIFYY